MPNAEMPMPEGAEQPHSGFTYYNVLPVLQPDPANPLALAIEDDKFDEYQQVVLQRGLDGGNAQFRLAAGVRGTRLLSRNSGKPICPANGRFVQMTLPREHAALADLVLLTAPRHQYRIAAAANPDRDQARVEGNALTCGGGAGTLFYLAPARKFQWLDSGETAPRNYQNETEMAIRAILGGALGFAGDKLSELAGVPGGSAALQFAMSLIWPDKSLSQILEEFRKDVLADVRNMMASEATLQAANRLVELRRAYAMQYRDTKRMTIDRADSLAALKLSAETYARNYGEAILALLPGLIQSDGRIQTPIPAERYSLVRSGINVYVAGAIDHLSALQERALIDVFDPRFVLRAYPRDHAQRYYEAGTDDRVRSVENPRKLEQTIAMVNIADGTIGDGDLLNFQVQNANYLSAILGGMGELGAYAKTPAAWETFRIERIAGKGKLQSNDRIALVSSDGYYLSVTGERLTVNAFQRGDDETFIVEKLGGAGDIRSGDKIGLRCANGKYLSAIEGGDAEVLARGGGLAAWELLTVTRVSVGSILRYGNDVVLRRPSDGRFATVQPERDGKRILLMENARITRNAIFTVTGGTAGTELKSGDAFTLRTRDGLFAGPTPSAGEMTVTATARPLVAEIVHPQTSALQAGEVTLGEPADWIASYANSYAANMQALLLYLVLRRQGQVSWARYELPRVGWRVEMNDTGVNRNLYRGMESRREDFPQTEAMLSEVKQAYLNHLAFNEAVVRSRPILAAAKLAAASQATVAMCNRLRRNLDVSSEYWRSAVIPDRGEWEERTLVTGTVR